jgi:hypothetical protein
MVQVWTIGRAGLIMFEFVDSSLICRDENCDIECIHAAHDVAPKKDPPKPRSTRAPWELPAPEALDESIVRNVSDVRPKIFSALVNDIENDFGSLGHNKRSGLRRVHRRIRALVEMGRILRVDIGDTLFAYLKPTSRVATDIEFVKEQILDSLSENCGRKIDPAYA